MIHIKIYVQNPGELAEEFARRLEGIIQGIQDKAPRGAANVAITHITSDSSGRQTATIQYRSGDRPVDLSNEEYWKQRCKLSEAVVHSLEEFPGSARRVDSAAAYQKFMQLYGER